MPWQSKAQAAWGHSPSGLKALGGASKVREWDSATSKGSLPDMKPPKKPMLGGAIKRG